MKGLRKPLIGFVIFSLLSITVQSEPFREKLYFKEALGLYQSKNYTFALNVLERVRNKLKNPESYYLLGLCYEAVGKYKEAVTWLAKSWRDFPYHRYTTSAAVEEAAIRAYIFNNRLSAAVTLDLARQKVKENKEEYCVILKNLIVLKKELGINTEQEEKEIKKRCQGLSPEYKIENYGEQNTENDTGG